MSMYSLKHSVNLSRRACRNVFLFLILGAALAAGQSTTPGAEAHNTYPGMRFGPMGPADRGPEPLAPSNLLLKQDDPNAATSTSSETTTGTAVGEKHPVERYKVFKSDFLRVETPFIIGLWIFFASVAKIGTSIFYIQNITSNYLTYLC